MIVIIKKVEGDPRPPWGCISTVIMVLVNGVNVISKLRNLMVDFVDNTSYFLRMPAGTYIPIAFPMP